MLYDKLIDATKEYIGPVAPSFVDGILKRLKLDKKNITQADLPAIADSAYEKTKAYTTLRRPIHEPIKQKLLELQ